MIKRIKCDDLPEFDAVPDLKTDQAITACLTDILEAHEAVLLAAAPEDIDSARRTDRGQSWIY